MAEILAAAVGAFLFLAGVVMGSRLAKGQPPVALPQVFKPPKKEKDPEEQGWASRDRPFVDEGVEE